MLRKPWYQWLIATLVVINTALFFWRRSARQSRAASRPAASDPAAPATPAAVLVPARRKDAPAQPIVPLMAIESGVATPPGAPPWPSRIEATLRARAITLDTALFIGALLVFALTRLIGLENFPIYFFTDEAIQTVQAASLLHNGFRDAAGVLFPTYFQNGSYYNLSVSVYAQVLPYWLFGYSIFVTRAVSVLIALSGAAAVGLILKQIFKERWWWVGTLLLAATPAFFLHSRTAFETVIGASLYAWFLYFYLRYRYIHPRNLLLALLFGALCFYAYSPAQLVVVVAGALLLLSDLRYHWQTLRSHPRIMALGVALLIVLALPYLRFQSEHPTESYYHLRILDSYLLRPDLAPGDKLKQFVDEYTYGLSPAFWYLPNDRDLIRHTMKGYGHIFLATLPFLLIGLLICFKNIRASRHRALLITLLAAPIGGALVQVQVYRVLMFVVPAALITSIGLVTMLGLLQRRVRDKVIAVGLFTVLAAISFAMLFDALAHGALWYNDYAIGGLQYGAKEIFSAVKDYLQRAPGDRAIVSPTWANGTDVLQFFLLPDEPRVQMGNIDAYRDSQLDLPNNLMFVMTPEEYQRAQQDVKFTNIREVRAPLKYPDGRDGFYFVKLNYSPQAGAVFASERLARHQPVRENFELGGQMVSILHSQFDVGRVNDLFDGDPFTLVRTLVDNPALIELTFPQPRPIKGINLTTGTMSHFVVTATVTTDANTAPRVYSRDFQGLPADPTVTLNFDPVPGPIQKLRIEIKDMNAPDEAKIHVREIQFIQ